jgi:hypothetical protein
MLKIHAAIRAAGFGKGGKDVPKQVIIGFVEPDGLATAVAHGFKPILPCTTTSRDVSQFVNTGTPGVPCGAVHGTPGACAAPTLVAPAVAHGSTPVMPTTPASPGAPGVPFGAAAAASADADFEVEEAAGYEGKGRAPVVRGGRAGYEGKGQVDGKGRVPVLRGGRDGYEGKGKPNSKGRKGSDRICRVTVRRGGRHACLNKGKSTPNASAAVATAVAATTATAVGRSTDLLTG